jgi:hypothetical protein
MSAKLGKYFYEPYTVDSYDIFQPESPNYGGKEIVENDQLKGTH